MTKDKKQSIMDAVSIFIQRGGERHMENEAKKTEKPRVPVQVTETNIFKALAKIQQDLKAPKGQLNKFANFSYRSCEDILEAVKPLLQGLVILMRDEVVQVGERYYLKATATLTNGKESIDVPAFARESMDKKGMDDAQITGATSSYARKYALNGLLAIDDAKDSDTKKEEKVSAEKLIKPEELKAIAGVLQSITNAKDAGELLKIGAEVKKGDEAKRYTASQLKVLREAYDGKKRKFFPNAK